MGRGGAKKLKPSLPYDEVQGKKLTPSLPHHLCEVEKTYEEQSKMGKGKIDIPIYDTNGQ